MRIPSRKQTCAFAFRRNSKHLVEASGHNWLEETVEDALPRKAVLFRQDRKEELALPYNGRSAQMASGAHLTRDAGAWSHHQSRVGVEAKRPGCIMADIDQDWDTRGNKGDCND